MIGETAWIKVRWLNKIADTGRPHGIRYTRAGRVWECSDPKPVDKAWIDPKGIFGPLSARERLNYARGTREQWGAIDSVLLQAEKAVLPVLEEQIEEKGSVAESRSDARSTDQDGVEIRWRHVLLTGSVPVIVSMNQPGRLSGSS